MRKTKMPRKMAAGGSITPEMLQGAGSLMGAFDFSQPSGLSYDVNQFSSTGRKKATRAAAVDAGADSAANAALATGNPYAMAGGAALKASNLLDNKVLRDKEGFYKNDAAYIASNVMNPFGAIKNTLKGEGFANYLLKGKNPLKGYREQKSKVMSEVARGKVDEMNKQTAMSGRLAALNQNSIPQFSAPAYGKKGLKFKRY